MATSMGNTDEQDSDTLYSILMVDKEATTAEVNAQYKKLSLQYHPDKHQNPDFKRVAENLFNKVKRARDVLADPQKRAIYDTVGMRGLEEFENSQLVVKDIRSPRDVIAEYERLKETKNYMEELKSYNPEGASTIGFDMTSLFESGYYRADEDVSVMDQFLEVAITQIKINQSIAVPIGDKDMVGVQFMNQVNYSGGKRGSGSTNITWRRFLPYSAHSNVSLSLSEMPMLGANVSKKFGKRLTLSFGVNGHFIQNRLFIGTSYSASYQLSPQLTAEMTFNAGLSEALRCDLRYSTNTFSFHPYIMSGSSMFAETPILEAGCLATKSFPEKALKLHSRVKLNLSDQSLSLGFSRDFSSQRSMLAMHLNMSFSSGIAMVIKLKRGNQSYRIPITMSNEIQPVALGYSVTLPLIAYIAVKALLVVPYLKQRQKEQQEKKLEEEKERLAKQRLEALDENDLMLITVQNNIRQEESIRGLVIVKALYGRLRLDATSGEDGANEKVANVTVPLQHQVRESKLQVPQQISKTSMPGFYDPCYGEEKKLYIRYKFHDRLHHVTLSDSDAISLPKQAHLISSSCSNTSS